MKPQIVKNRMVSKKSISSKKQVSSENINTIQQQKLEVNEGVLYSLWDINYKNWSENIYFHSSIIDYISYYKNNGVHSLNLTKLPLDILMQNAEEIESNDYIIISFNGDVLRGDKQAPFFVFSGIANKINKPLIAFSDPTLSMRKGFGLAWYAGNEYYPNLPDIIANICDQLVEVTGKKLLLVGGSGGGFAALNVQSRMEKKAETISFVWNPQTDLLEFARTPVARYMSYAYPSDNVDFTKNVNDPSLDTFTYSKIDSIIKVNSENKSYIVMDGYDALHLRQHLAPYLSNEIENIIVNNNIVKLNNLSVVIGDWADSGIGHVPLPRDQAAEIIEQLMRNDYQFEKDAFFKSNRSFLNLDVHNLSDLKTIFSKVSDHLMIECDISDKYTGYQLRYVVRKHSGDIAFRTGFVGYTSKAKSFIKINDKFPLDQLHRFSIEVEIYDFFGNVFTLSNKIIRNSMREYGVNSIWG